MNWAEIWVRPGFYIKVLSFYQKHSNWTIFAETWMTKSSGQEAWFSEHPKWGCRERMSSLPEMAPPGISFTCVVRKCFVQACFVHWWANSLGLHNSSRRQVASENEMRWFWCGAPSLAQILSRMGIIPGFGKGAMSDRCRWDTPGFQWIGMSRENTNPPVGFMVPWTQKRMNTPIRTENLDCALRAVATVSWWR